MRWWALVTDESAYAEALADEAEEEAVQTIPP